MKKQQYFSFKKLRQKHYIKAILLVLIFASQYMLADGTRQVSPGNNNGTPSTNGTAYLVNPDGSAGSYPGSPANTKMRVTITNFNTERILSGFMARTLSTTSTTLVTNAYIRITNPSGTVVFQSLIPSSGTGAITSYAQAWAGPTLGGNNAGGYTPFNYTPTVNGEYIIELYRSSTADGNTPITGVGAGGQVTFPLFDISVATLSGTTVNQISGRLWSREWSFVTTDLSNASYPNVITSSFDGSFFVYTNDGFKAQVIFRPNFRPLGFQLVMNYWGIANTGNFANDSKSRNGTFTAPNTVTYPTIPEGYRVFLTGPDIVAFPNGSPGNPAITGAIYGCPGAYYIPYYVDKAGDVAITLDLDGVAGYQAGGADRVLQAYDVPVGNNIMAWNGNNGLGAAVPTSFSVTVSVLLLQGRVNVPMIDAELNTNGFSATAIFPALGNRPMFWDDSGASGSGLTAFGSSGNNNSNLTTGGTRTPNLRSGIPGPTHAWDGSNPTLATPAPLTANQGSNTINTLEDDYGNGRIINTWFYGSQSESPSRTLSLPGCDNDFDGIDNNADLDDDNDGILDTVENRGLTDPLGDHDGDGVPNYIDPQFPGFVDTNFDGVDDRYDLDLDGIINQFDTDADGDGCADAIEGSEYVTAAQIHSLTLATTDSNYPYRGQIRVLANGTSPGTPVEIRNANGVPLLVNPGGVADNTDGSSEVGQGLGISQTAAYNGCTDSDNDGVPDYDDLDSDNDGILDTVECPSTNAVVNGTFDTGLGSWTANPTTGGWDFSSGTASNSADNASNHTLTQVLTNLDKLQGGMASLTLTVGTRDASNVGGESASLSILLNGVVYATLNNSTARAAGTNNVTITLQNGATSTFTPASTNGAASGVFTTQTFTLLIPYSGPASAPLSFSMTSTKDDWSVDNVSIPVMLCDTDNDTIPNYLDVDSDGDGCADAVEGSEYVTPAQIHPLTLQSTDPNYNFRGQIRVIYDGATVNNNPAQVISTATAALGVPQLVNPAGAGNNNPTTNSTNAAGVADNTDGTSEIGQGLGVSLTASINACTDSDNDGIPDEDDLDDDNDGILDSVEKAQNCPTYFTPNSVSTTATNVATGRELTLTIDNDLATFGGAAGGITSLNGSVTYIYTNALTLPMNTFRIYPNGGNVNTDGQVRRIGSLKFYNNAGVLMYEVYDINVPSSSLATADHYTDVPLPGLVGIKYFVMDGLVDTSASAQEVIWREVRLFTCTFKDTDGDGTPDYLDLDSDGDGCPDAVEGSETVTYRMINPMTATSNPGQINVLANGTTPGTPPQVISTLAAARGVPQVVNNGTNNYNILNNTNNTAGAVDNTDVPAPTTADLGQGIGTSANAAQQDAECRCFKPANTATAGLPTNHGITALGRGGADNGNWPMKITGAYTVLDAKTKGFVINRLTTTQISNLVPVRGMMAYDTTENCLKIYDGTSWACYTQQTCDQY